MSYISQEDYKSLMSKFQKQTPKGVLKEAVEEGNAFTAALAKTKKGKKFKVGGKEFKDKTSYDAPIQEEKIDGEFDTVDAYGDPLEVFYINGEPYVESANIAQPSPFVFPKDKIAFKKDGQWVRAVVTNKSVSTGRHYEGLKLQIVDPGMRGDRDYRMDEYGYADNYPGSWGYREGKDIGEDKIDLSNTPNFKKTEEGAEVLRFLGKKTYEIRRPDGKISQVVFDEEEVVEEVDPPYSAVGYVAGSDEKYEYNMDADFTNMGGGDWDADPDYESLVATLIVKEGLHTPPLQATGPTIDVNEESSFDFTKSAIESASGDKISHTEEDDFGELIYWSTKYPEVVYFIAQDGSENIIKYDGETGEGYSIGNLKHYDTSIEEDYTDSPFKLPKRRDTAELDYDPQASRFEPDYMKTPGELDDEDDDDDDNIGIEDDDDQSEFPKHFKGQVAKDKGRFPFLRENSNEAAPYGFSVLSPDERKQLKEYIESIKTIKSEIAKLTAKAGKKVKEGDLGGDRTGLVMTPTTMSEGQEEIEKIEKKIPEKLYTASVRVIEELRKAGLTDGEIEMFLNHEIEEKAKEAIMGQHD